MMGNRSGSAERRERSRPASVRRLGYAMGDVVFLAAIGRLTGLTDIILSTGRTAGRPRFKTLSCFAVATIGGCTKRVGGLPGAKIVSWSPFRLSERYPAW